MNFNRYKLILSIIKNVIILCILFLFFTACAQMESLRKIVDDQEKMIKQLQDNNDECKKSLL